MKKRLLALGLFVASAALYITVESSAGPRYQSVGGSTVFEWLSMRYTEGLFPDVDPNDIASIQQAADLALIASPADEPRVTWLGHATMLVQYQGVSFLTDPHLSNWAAPVDFGVTPRLSPPALSVAQLPKVDFVVISHNHYDHLDHRTVDEIGNSVTWYVPMGLKAWFLDRGIEDANVVELDWWQSAKFKGSVEITFTPNVHWSKRSPWDTNLSHWGAWAVNIAGFKSWFSGDTAYDQKMFREIGERLGPFDMAFIPIGAYAPRYFMARQHVDPQQAVKIHQDIRSKFSVPMHWATFQLTQEPFLEPAELLIEALNQANIPLQKFKPINIGETVSLSEY